MHDQPDNPRNSDQTMDRLVSRDRIVEARMLPKQRKLTNREIANVRQRLATLIDSTKDAEKPLTINGIAAEVSYGASSISEFLRNQYRGKSDLVARALNKWIERYQHRAVSKLTQVYVPTWICEQMIAAIRYAVRNERMAAIVAPSGSGKDMVINFLLDELNGHVIHCDRKTTGTQLLQRIAIACGVSHRRCPGGELIRRIADALKGRQIVIFLNEAQTLPAEAAGVIRSIYDQTGVVFIMLGSHDILTFIDDRTDSGGGQFWRRCVKFNIVNRAARVADPADPTRMGRPLYTIDEIERFVASRQLRLADDDALQMLWRLACLAGRGTLGLVNAILMGIADIYGREVPVTADLIASQLFMEDDGDADDILGDAEKLELALPAARKSA
ncbi:MAG: AAA family ATPase [Phycisphaeraceae bacterium]|nr:AAA family ATPase [Phycisphaeraceae bacterium]